MSTRLPRRTVLASLAAAGLVVSAGRAAMLRGSIVESEMPGLRSRARGFLYGSAAATFQFKDGDFTQALAHEAAMLVPEYELKRGTVEAVRGRYDFSGGDQLLAFADAHGQMLRGHTLLWHHANPDWLEAEVASTRDIALLTDYIAAVAGHYRGRMHSWDVVNEIIAPEDGRSDGLRKTLWLDAFGPSYVDTAFHAAKEADPSALLVYNDWGCEMAAPENDRFRAATLDFLESARARGVPIEALGVQGHLAAFGHPVDQGKLRVFLDRVASLGLKILVTEHDVDDSGGPSDIAQRDRAVADASRRFLDVALDCPATVAVLTWGLSDRFLAPQGWHDRLWQGTPRKLPLDPDLAPTPMWHAMAETFAAARA